MSSPFNRAATLTQADRCDRCPAAAHAVIVLESGGRLDFCKHHLDRHEVALATVGAEIHRKDY